jgi:hypothetical protein
MSPTVAEVQAQDAVTRQAIADRLEADLPRIADSLQAIGLLMLWSSRATSGTGYAAVIELAHGLLGAP